MEKIIIKPSIKPMLFFIGLAVLGSTPFIVGTKAVPYWAGACMYLLGVGALFTLKKIELSEHQISAHYFLLFKQIVYTRDEITSISIGYLPQTTASSVGLMKRGEVIRINGDQKKPITITSTMENRFKEMVIFLEDYYGDKIR